MPTARPAAEVGRTGVTGGTGQYELGPVQNVRGEVGAVLQLEGEAAGGATGVQPLQLRNRPTVLGRRVQDI